MAYYGIDNFDFNYVNYVNEEVLFSASFRPLFLLKSEEKRVVRYKESIP
jgi:hypothetical protein